MRRFNTEGLWRGLLVSERKRRRKGSPIVLRLVWDGVSLIEEGQAKWDDPNTTWDDWRRTWEGGIR